MKFTQAQIMDGILQYCFENSSKGHIGVDHLIENLLPELNRDEVELLLSEISNSTHPVADVRISEYASLISATGLTERFLEQGGFRAIEEKEKEEARLAKEKEQIEHKKNKVDLELAERILKEYPKTKWMARAGFLISLVLAALEIARRLGLLADQ